MGASQHLVCFPDVHSSQNECCVFLWESVAHCWEDRQSIECCVFLWESLAHCREDRQHCACRVELASVVGLAFVVSEAATLFVAMH